MDIRIPPVRHALTTFFIRVYRVPVILVYIFVLSVMIPFIIDASNFGLFLGAVVGGALVVLLWTGAVGTASSWPAIVVTAEHLDAKFDPIAAVNIHFTVVREFLESSLGQLANNLAAVAIRRAGVHTPTAPDAETLDVLTQALSLNLAETLLYLTDEQRAARIDEYVSELKSTLGNAPKPEGGVLQFLSSRYHNIDRSVQLSLRGWKPAPSFLTRIESHPVALGAVLTFILFIAAIVAVVVWKAPVPYLP